MNRSRFHYIWLVLSLVFFAHVVSFRATAAFQEGKKQEKKEAEDGDGDASSEYTQFLSTMKLPTVKQILDEEPLDWIVLRKEPNGEFPVLVAKGLPNRPKTLPQYEKEGVKKIIGIELPVLGIKEMDLSLIRVDRFIYAEELMLRVAEKLLDSGTPDDLETAFEIIATVEANIPKWDKTIPTLQRLLVLDARKKLEKKEPELALALLEECHLLKAGFPEVDTMVSSIVDGLVSQAVQERDFRKAQHFLRRCGESFPQNPIRQRWLQRLQAMAQKHFDKSATQFQAKDYPSAAAEVQEGNRVWRAEGDNDRIYREILGRYQQVNVGVLSSGQKFPVKTSAQKRHDELQSIPLFEPDRADSVMYYDTPYFEQWDPLDLGRRVVFTLRKQQPHWSGLPKITSPHVIDTIKAKLDPKNKAYDERFASYIKEFLVQTPFEFEVRFSRIPLRVESLFSFPLTTPDGEIFSKRFDRVGESEGRTTFRRSHVEPEGLSLRDYHVAEVVEHKFEQSHQAVQALQRGEIQMIAHLQPWEIDAFESNKRFYRRQYAMPFVHVIQFNPKTEILKNTQVRRALSMSIDRERILKKTILKDPAMRHGRVVAAPWPSKSYANSSLVDVPGYDIAGLKTAAALKGTAEMVLKNKEKGPEGRNVAKKDEPEEEEVKGPPKTKALPKLRLILEEDPVIQKAGPEIVKFWKAVGFEVEIVETTDDPDSWDLVYHKVRMHEPLIDIWPFLTLRDKAEVDGLLILPDWLKQKMVDLDFTGNFPAAAGHLRLLHRHLTAQGFFIALWEIDDYSVYALNVRGFANTPVTPYQRVTQWAVKPSPGN